MATVIQQHQGGSPIRPQTLEPRLGAEEAGEEQSRATNEEEIKVKHPSSWIKALSGEWWGL